ncbi:MAG TPA: PepSY-associated TM helix domain-containing protein [Vicinamibacterales bacterium]|jgi:uncharacterized iron-regulated membrane protein|nr:PepSY-associated TM helix domain-containing protein [Vicinamibacterales bacterium]
MRLPSLRTVLFWSHLTAGVMAGVAILIMSLTGVLLMYERQLIEWSDRQFYGEPPSAAERLPIEALLTRAQAQRPGPAPTAITLRSDVSAPAAVAFGQTTAYFDAYSGVLLGEPTTDVRWLMSRLRAWHRWMALDGDNRPLGKAISGWSNAAFFFIVLSGMYLWIPRRWNWSSVRAVVMFKGGLRGKARDFNWHNVVGIWSAVPLAIVVATAMPISFSWANALVYKLVGESVPAAGGGGEGANRPGAEANRRRATPSFDGVNTLWATAERQAPGWRTINLRLPNSSDAPAVFAIDAGTGGQPQFRSTLTLDPLTGDVVRWETFADQSLGRRLRSWSRFTHTGEYYGIAGQTIAGLASAGGTVLVWTGVALAWRRFRAWALAGTRVLNPRSDRATEAA